MNLLEIVTLNKHGDFEEVLFSSILSYMLNPAHDHGLKHLFLQKVVKEVYPEISDSEMLQAKATSEQPLGKAGKVDILITAANKIIAVEVKIWDRSAKNISEAGISQVERYCDYLSKKYDRADWRFIYLIPTFDSPRCLSEFEKAYSKDYRGNLKLMAWNPPNEESLIASKFTGSAFVEKSILDMIAEILENKEVKRVKIPLNTLWLLDSLQDFIPNLLRNVPDTVKFPLTEDLQKNLDTWKIFDILFATAKRWPSPILTTVGVPYGVGPNKADLHGNSLYRIRTTKDYYIRKDDKVKNLPKDRVELELWPDVYEKVEGELLTWLEKLNLGKQAISESTHIDRKRNEPIILVSINKDVILTDNDISDFNAILRSGFDKLMKAPTN